MEREGSNLIGLSGMMKITLTFLSHPLSQKTTMRMASELSQVRVEASRVTDSTSTHTVMASVEPLR